MSIIVGEDILIVNETLTINGTTPSINYSTGALIVMGGVGIGENVNIAGISTLSNLVIGSGTTSYAFPTETGSEFQILSVNTSGNLIFTNPSVTTNNVIATNDFGIDNRLTKT